MTLLTWLAVGAIAGFVASLISGSREGLIMMVVLGIVGAIVGGWLAVDVLKIKGVTGVNLTSITGKLIDWFSRPATATQLHWPLEAGPVTLDELRRIQR